MDETAIREISRLAIEAAGAQKLTDTQIPGFLVDGKLIPTEHLLEGRKRYRGIFETTVLADFASYVVANKAAGVQGFIQPDSRQAVAFLNLGTTDKPGHGDWRANLSLVKTAGYKALCELPPFFTQRSLAEWCEDWAAYLKAPGDQTLAQAVAAIRSVQIAQKQTVASNEQQFSAQRTALEEVEASSRASVLPETLTFTVEPHPGFDQRPFALRVNLGQDATDKPRFVLRVVGKESIEEGIADEFKSKLDKAINDGVIPITIGTFKP